MKEKPFHRGSPLRHAIGRLRDALDPDLIVRPVKTFAQMSDEERAAVARSCTPPKAIKRTIIR